MEKILIKSLSIAELKKSINELRDTLNELCATVSEVEDASKKLDMSQHLDELIVEYMYRMDNKNFNGA
jgi:hypothetical protein